VNYVTLLGALALGLVAVLSDNELTITAGEGTFSLQVGGEATPYFVIVGLALIAGFICVALITFVDWLTTRAESAQEDSPAA
jgi:hypothetical protein